jgi:predicted nicotinamide N-methyase
MPTQPKKEIRAYGIRVLLSPHPRIRKLKREHFPTSHGNKFWTSSWLLMDYFKRHGLAERTSVMEIGCGWALAGIYCAKRHGARVTGVDIDPDVFPFSKLHAHMNGVRIAFMKKSFNSLRIRDMEGVDILVGADICFWDEMIDPLKRLIQRALRAGVKSILIADPVRSPFEELCDYFIKKGTGELLDWKVRRPRPIRGRILKVISPDSHCNRRKKS